MEYQILRTFGLKRGQNKHPIYKNTFLFFLLSVSACCKKNCNALEGVYRTSLSSYFFLSGPFKVLLSSPAGLEEVMDYADFKEELSLLSLDDELTLEDEPDEQDLHELVSGNITVNGSRLIILPSG